jgi:hypothetical protein
VRKNRFLVVTGVLLQAWPGYPAGLRTRIYSLASSLASFLSVPPSPTYLGAGNKAGGGRWMDGEAGSHVVP